MLMTVEWLLFYTQNKLYHQPPGYVRQGAWGSLDLQLPVFMRHPFLSNPRKAW